MEKSEIDTFTADHLDWHVENGELAAQFELSDFMEVQEKISEIMRLAQEQDHHPEVTFGYNTIVVRTVTHDAGNTITEKDLALASGISALVQ